MSMKNKIFLKSKWIDKYIPTEEDYAEFFDSFYNKLDDPINSGTGVLYTEILYSDLLTLKQNNALFEGTFYQITDRADLGITINAMSNNQISLNGYGIFMNPDYNDLNITSNGFVFNGIWNNALIPTINMSVCIWNGLMYRNITGVNTSNNPSIDTTNWQLLDKVNYGYLYNTETDFILYDLDTDTILERNDKRGNHVEKTSINIFQFGNNIVTNNKVLNESYFNCINNNGLVKNNFINNATVNIINNSIEVNNNTFTNNCNITLNFLVGKLTNCNINTNITSTLDDIEHINKTINNIGSTFEASLDLSFNSIYTTNVLTIPSYLNYVGIFTLENNSGVTIKEVIGLPRTHKCGFYSKNTENYNFTTTPILSAIFNQIVSDSTGTINIVGRGERSICDYIELEAGQYFNKRSNIIKLY